MPLLKKSFETFQRKAAPSEREQFEVFCQQNTSWLETYSLFMALEEAHGLAAWNTWEKVSEDGSRSLSNAGSKKLDHEIRCHKYQQYQFFKQWSELKKYCNEHGIRLIGDMPYLLPLIALRSGRTQKCSIWIPVANQRWWPGCRLTTLARQDSYGESPLPLGCNCQGWLCVVD